MKILRFSEKFPRLQKLLVGEINAALRSAHESGSRSRLPMLNGPLYDIVTSTISLIGLTLWKKWYFFLNASTGYL